MTYVRRSGAATFSAHPALRGLERPREDGYFMDVALRLARYGEPAPNPAVGAVVVRCGEVVGSGYHTRAGEAHAEVVALQNAGSLAAGATLYVTLEPCNHFGRTPPCVDAIERSRVRRVVIGCI